jgi:enoyl-CoA hydratase/carnithine racemase
MSWPDYETIRVEPAANHVTTVLLNRPEVLNACNPTMHEELIDAFGRAEQDEQTRVVLLAGAGRAFCAGSDVSVTRNLHGQAARDYIALDMAAKNVVAGLRKPTVASLHGYVLGGGLELALACDLRVAAEDTVCGLPEVTLGTIAGAGGLQRLPDLVGLGIAREWALSGRRVTAAEGARTGLLNRVVPTAELHNAVSELAREIAAHSPLAVELTKAALNRSGHRVLDGDVVAFHQLSSAACHDDDGFRKRTGRVLRDPD